MADISVTAANVITTATNAKTGIAGATITAGQGLYLHTDGTLRLAQADGTAAEAAFVGVSLCGAAAGQPVLYQPSGDITIGGTVVVGAVYTVSAAAGGICPTADITTTGHYRTIIGYGKTASVLSISPVVTGVALP